MYDSKHETTRKEAKSTLMSNLHIVPKKISDVAQTQGVSEKFLSNGLPSGVINPSLLAHDRWLSSMDAIQDVIILTLIVTISPLLPLNWFTITCYILVSLYWIFHIGWWEKTRIWGIKSSAKRYLRNTYWFYWSVLLLFSTPVIYFLWYYIFLLSLESSAFGSVNWVLGIAAGAERAIADILSNVNFIANHFSKTAKYSIVMNETIYEGRFIISSSIVIGSTLLARIFFGRLYASEKRDNREFSEQEMLYTGESALNKILDETRKK